MYIVYTSKETIVSHRGYLIQKLSNNNNANCRRYFQTLRFYRRSLNNSHEPQSYEYELIHTG